MKLQSRPKNQKNQKNGGGIRYWPVGGNVSMAFLSTFLTLFRLSLHSCWFMLHLCSIPHIQIAWNIWIFVLACGKAKMFLEDVSICILLFYFFSSLFQKKHPSPSDGINLSQSELRCVINIEVISMTFRLFWGHCIHK